VESTSEHIDRFKALHLKPNEKIELFVNGYIGNALGTGDNVHYGGSLIITDNRVAFFHKGEYGDVFKTVPLAGITDIRRKAFLGHRTIHISTEHNALIFKTFSANSAHLIYDWLSMRLLRTAPSATG
jgi:PH (Pleckstrin Homology) domain-containing protein